MNCTPNVLALGFVKVLNCEFFINVTYYQSQFHNAIKIFDLKSLLGHQLRLKQVNKRLDPELQHLGSPDFKWMNIFFTIIWASVNFLPGLSQVQRYNEIQLLSSTSCLQMMSLASNYWLYVYNQKQVSYCLLLSVVYFRTENMAIVR